MSYVISIGSDRNLFKEGTDVEKRIKDYGRLFDELHIIVFTPKGYAEKNFGNVYLYPTNSFSRIFYIFGGIFSGIKILKNLKVKNCVITSQDPFEAGLVAYVLKKLYYLPFQLQIHTDLFSPYFIKLSVLNRLRAWLALFLIPRADCIRVVSERIARSLNAKRLTPNAEPFVLPIYVDVEKIRSVTPSFDLHAAYPEFRFIVLMASRLRPEKNIKLAINAFESIKIKDKGVGLVIVGEGPGLVGLRAEALRLDLLTNVKFENWTDDLASYYKTADLFLLTSDYEGYGRTAIEALSAGLPVVMSDVGIAGDTVKDGKNGLIFPVGDSGTLTQKLISAIADEALYLEIKMGASRFSMPVTYDEYLRRYKEGIESCIGAS